MQQPPTLNVENTKNLSVITANARKAILDIKDTVQDVQLTADTVARLKLANVITEKSGILILTTASTLVVNMKYILPMVVNAKMDTKAGTENVLKTALNILNGMPTERNVIAMMDTNGMEINVNPNMFTRNHHHTNIMSHNTNLIHHHTNLMNHIINLMIHHTTMILTTDMEKDIVERMKELLPEEDVTVNMDTTDSTVRIVTSAPKTDTGILMPITKREPVFATMHSRWLTTNASQTVKRMKDSLPVEVVTASTDITDMTVSTVKDVPRTDIGT